MTDAAVGADSGAMPDGGAPISDTPASFSQPLGSQIPDEATAKPDAAPAKPASLDESLDRAIAKSEAKQAAPKDAPKDAKPEPAKDVKPEQPRENGKFASTKPAEPPQTAQQAPKPAEQPKPSFTANDAPARFSEDAKRDWHTAPESVRRESERAIKELTDGYQKYREKAERDDTLAEFHDLAKQHGTDVKTALTNYTTLERALKSSDVQTKLGALEEVFRNAGISPRDYAAHILGQSPDEQASQSDATIRELRNEIISLKQQVGGVQQTFQQQRVQSTLQEVTKFAADNPRFDELSDDIAFFLKSGRASDISEAYKLAERLNPAPGSAPISAAASTAAPDPAPAHTDKGQKSINGAPSAGLTSPTRKRAARSIDESLEIAFGNAS